MAGIKLVQTIAYIYILALPPAKQHSVHFEQSLWAVTRTSCHARSSDPFCDSEGSGQALRPHQPSALESEVL